MSNEIFDELFALRVGLQDIYTNEKDIIREIKMFLLSKNINSNNDQLILDFYKNYNINFPIEFISEVNVLPPMSIPPNMQLFNGNHFRNLIINSLNQHTNETIEEVDEDLDDEDSDDELLDQTDSDHINEEILNDNSSQLIFDSSNNLSDQSNNNLEFLINDHSNNSSQNFTFNINSGNTVNLFTNTLNQSINFQNTNYQNPENFFTVLNNMINSPPSIAVNEMEDVKVTLDDNDLENIKQIKLTENLDSKCSICMMGLEKDQIVSQLECEHVFHTDCIKHWLKEYNYKCPVCRKECGKPKYEM